MLSGAKHFINLKKTLRYAQGDTLLEKLLSTLIEFGFISDIPAPVPARPANRNHHRGLPEQSASRLKIQGR